MKISVVIPNYNGAKLIQNYLQKVIDVVGEAEIIVVDDASTDESVKLLKNEFQNVLLIEVKRNQGFASTVNRGVKEATGEFVLLLNTDVIPENNFLGPLIEKMHNQNVFAVGCLQISREGNVQRIHGRGIGKFEKGFLMHGPGDPNKDDTLWVFGGAGLFRKSIWQKLGGLCNLYDPFYWEDIDLSYRAIKSGYKILFEPRSIVHHDQGATIKGSSTSENIKIIAYRNQFLFVWLNISAPEFIFQHFIFIPYHIMKAILGGEYAFLRGLILAILKLKQVIYYRNNYKHLWKIPDKSII